MGIEGEYEVIEEWNKILEETQWSIGYWMRPPPERPAQGYTPVRLVSFDCVYTAPPFPWSNLLHPNRLAYRSRDVAEAKVIELSKAVEFGNIELAWVRKTEI